MLINEYTRNNLNVKRLLELGILDIRGTARKNPLLSADEYFSKVEDFIENASQYFEILKNVSELASNIKALKELETKLGVASHELNVSGNVEALNNMKKVLDEIGYNGVDNDINSIFNAINAGDIQKTKIPAEMALSTFEEFFEKLKYVSTKKKITRNAPPTPVGDNPAVEVENTILLKEALEYLDYVEANRKLRVLTVDDVSAVLNHIVSVLSPHYEVYALKSGTLVEKFLTQITPDLILLDIEMGSIRGFDLAILIRTLEKHKDTPIIFLTGNASINNLKDAIAVGACDFISKPVDKTILLEKIEKHIVRKKLY